MKHLFSYSDYIFESVKGVDYIYNTYYSEIPRDKFDKIIFSDPTTRLKKPGIYCKWLLKLYESDMLKIEDLYKAAEYLSIFHNFKYKLPEKDIFKIKDLPALLSIIEPFVDKEEIKFTNEEERALAGQFKEVYKNKDYRIIIPLTLKASQYFGQGSKWCTTKPDMFKRYTRKQTTDITPFNLYILYSERPENRLQFHFRFRQFMDINDKPIDKETFFKLNISIYDFFSNYFSVEKYYNAGSVDWLHRNFNDAPDIIEGNFDCCNLGITSLEGAPKIIEGYFDCEKNVLETLKGAPHTVEGGFYCSHNRLTSLEGSPKIVEGEYFCSYNDLTSLKGAPELIYDGFSCCNNLLTSLEGAPKIVRGDFFCGYNNLKSLKGAPALVEGDFYCEANPDLSMEEIEKYRDSGAVKGNFVWLKP